MYVAIKTEEMERKSVWDGNPDGIIRALGEAERVNYPYLGGIAWYEDTYFNTLQVTGLKSDLLSFKEEFEEEDTKKEIDNLINYIQSIEIGELVCFVGD